MLEFSSLGAFVQHLDSLTAIVEASQHRGLKHAAAVVEQAAKDEIGHYQPAVGESPAWAMLAESTEVHKARMGYPADAPLLATGDMRKNISHQVEGNEAVIGSPDDRAVYHEFGTSKMPPRPVFGPVAFKTADQMLAIVGQRVVSALVGKNVRIEDVE